MSLSFCGPHPCLFKGGNSLWANALSLIPLRGHECTSYPLCPASCSEPLTSYLYSVQRRDHNCRRSRKWRQISDMCRLKKQVVKKKKKKKVWLCGNYVWLPRSRHGVPSFVLIAFAQSEWPPSCPSLLSPPVSVCSLSLLCSLSEDWGEPVSSCDEGLLRDAAAVHERRGWCRTEVTGRRRGSVEFHQPHSLHIFIIFFFFTVNYYIHEKSKGLTLWLCGVYVSKERGFLSWKNIKETQNVKKNTSLPGAHKTQIKTLYFFKS